MAGKRQHYVPRLLQRRFLNDPIDSTELTWLHRPGTAARLVGIRDVGVDVTDWPLVVPPIGDDTAMFGDPGLDGPNP